MKKSNCGKLEPLLFWYLDNYLNPKQVKIIEQHLQSCEHCRKYFEELKQVYGLLSDVKPSPSSPGLDARINEKVRNLQPLPNYTVGLIKLWFYTRWGLAIAILFFVVAQSFNYIQDMFIEQNNKIILRKHEIPKKEITLTPQRVQDRLALNPVQRNYPAERIVKIPSPEKIKSNETKEIKPEVEKEEIQIVKSEIQQKMPIEAASKPTETIQQSKLQIPPILSEEPKKEIEQTKESILHKTTKDEVIQDLVNKGIPVESAQQTVKSAISHGYTIDKLNQIVTNPKSSTVSLSPRRTIQEQVGSFKFEEATPNPFTPNGDGINDEIFFKYQNPEGLTVRIKIYNLNDVVIKNIEVVPIEYALWNGINENGEIVESGIYIYTLQAGENIIKGTMILAK